LKEKSIRNHNITDNKLYDQYFAPLRWIKGEVSEMLNLWLKVDLQGDLKRSRRIFRVKWMVALDSRDQNL
jgi:hypothetical protein